MDFVFAFHEQIEHLFRVDDCFSEVGHQADEGRVPFVRDFREGRAAGRHEDLAHSVFESLHGFVVDAQEGLRGDFLRGFVLEFPDAVALREGFVE